MNGPSLDTSMAGHWAETGAGENGTGAGLANTRHGPEQGQSGHTRRTRHTAYGQQREVPSTERDTGSRTDHQKEHRWTERWWATKLTEDTVDQFLRSHINMKSTRDTIGGGKTLKE